MQKELKMYDSLWESHPKVKAIKAEVAEKKAQIEAEARKMREECMTKNRTGTPAGARSIFGQKEMLYTAISSCTS